MDSPSSSHVPAARQPLRQGHAAGATPQSQPSTKSCDSFARTRKCELLQRPAPNHSLKKKIRVGVLKAARRLATGGAEWSGDLTSTLAQDDENDGYEK